MQSRKIDKFDKCFEKLPKEIQKAAIDCFNNWKKDPSSLDFKPLGISGNMVWSAKINRKYRALALKSFTNDDSETCYNWFWIGSHEDYNNIIKTLNNNQKLNNIANNQKRRKNTP